jgi:hypothetical protein
MLAEDLTLSATAGSLSNIGTLSAQVFSLVHPAAVDGTNRRVAATAMTDRYEMMIRHQLTGKSFAERHRMLLKFIYTKMNQDTSVTGGIKPSASVSFSFDRPSQMSALVTDAVMKELLGFAMAVMLTTGNAAKFFNMEA